PVSLNDRVARAISQRIHMVERKKTSPISEEFSVLGSTGNIYTVNFSHVPSCTSPDFGKSTPCKYVVFVFCKVLGIPPYKLSIGRLGGTGKHYYLKALLTSELEEVFANARPEPTALASANIAAALRAATGEGEGEAEGTGAGEIKLKMRGPDDACPICFEEMLPPARLTHCTQSCGNALHTDCFQKLKAAKKRAHERVTCVYCRAEVAETSAVVAKSSPGRVSTKGYLNLGREAGLPSTRDLESYTWSGY
ncbi:hypothetical protein BDK51DRAFT_4885, partial [Blyttiomyces helicus]